jgi:hypothetical protein
MKFEGWFNSCAETQLLVNHKKTTLKINWNFILCLLGVRLHHISILGLFFISFAWGSNSRFNSALETQLLVNHTQKTLESIETSYFVYWGWNRTIYIYIYILNLSLFWYCFLEVLIWGSILPQKHNFIERFNDFCTKLMTR